jgi:hypothetical protein
MSKIPKHYIQIADVFVDWPSIQKKIKPGATANDCTTWTGGHHPQGYAMCGAIDAATSKRKMITLHRLIMKQKLGRDLDRKECVIHTCSNAECLNPDHLVLGDYIDRSQNMLNNGRANPLRGKNIRSHNKQNRVYKYTDEEILWIRKADTLDIAEKYGVTRSKASHIRWHVRNTYHWLA